MSNPASRNRPRKWALLWVVFGSGCLAIAFGPPLLAAEAERRFFNVPADEAENSLKRFADQSGAEVVFASPSASKVRTNAVKGHYSPREALDRMVANTTLTVVVHGRTGTLMIHNEAEREEAARPSSGPEPIKKKSPDPLSHSTPMKPRNPFVLLGTLLSLAFGGGAEANAASSAEAELVRTVHGQVLDDSTGAPLVGAEVSIGGQVAAISGNDGTFVLRHVRAGSQAKVNYLGYKPRITSVTPDGDQTIELRLQRGDEIVNLDPFNVIADYDADTRARNKERNADSLSNIISSDAIGNLPDAQVGDALRRLPGISAVRTLGESATIVIRGADPSLNSMNLDGVPIQSTANDGNTVDLSMFLTEQLNSIEVVKAITPDLPADSVGGYVNFETKSALDYKAPLLSARAKVGYDTLQKKYTPEVGFTYVTQFGRNKQFGFSISASYVKRFAQSLLLETGRALVVGPIVTPTATYTNVYMPASIQPRINHLDRDRYGLTTGFEWQAFPQTRLYLKSSFNIQHDDSAAERIRWFTSARTAANFDLTKPFRVVENNIVEATTRTVAAGDNMQRGLTLGELKQSSMIQKIGGRSDFERLRLDYSVAYSRTKTNQELMVPLFSNVGIAVRLHEEEVGRPHYESVAGLDLNDPNLFRLNGVQHDIHRKNYDLWGAKVDATYSARLMNRPVTFKFGGVGSRSKKVRDDNQFIPSPSPGGNAFKDSRVMLLSDPSITTIRMASDYLESYDLGFGPDATAAKKWAKEMVNSGLLNEATPANYVTARTQNDYTIEQDIFAGYAMAAVKSERVNVMAGVRSESTEDRGVALARNGTNLTPIRMSRLYDFLAPNVHLRYRPGEKWQMRASYTETMRRPPYDSAAPRTTWSVAANGTLTASSFNPDLKHQISENTDLSIEYYLGRTNRVTVAGFSKDISDTLFTESSILMLEEAAPEIQDLFPSETASTTQLTLTRSGNSGTGRIRGVEMEYLQRLSFLPGFWGKFGLSTSFTYIESSWTRLITSTPTVKTSVTTAFPFQSKTLGNVALDFGSGKFYAVISYNWRDPFLRAVNATDRNLDSWMGNAESIDWKIAYRLRPRLGLELRGQNMRQDADTAWFGRPEEHRLNNYERTGIMFWTGVNWQM